MSYVNLRYMPSPNREYAQSFTNFTGGINIWEPDYGLKASESPDMKNLIWRNGMLRSRKGQEYRTDDPIGNVYAVYSKPWHGKFFAHIGEGIYYYDAGARSCTALISSGVPIVGGTFFTYDSKLYYKTKGAYKVITYSVVDNVPTFTAGNVIPYIPVTIINADPTTAAGDLYQPENRIQPRKIVWYNAQQGVTQYHLPVLATTVTKVEVDGVELQTGWAYNTSTGIVTFNTAPPVTDPATNNTVRITYLLENSTAYDSIDECNYVEVYGGTGELCVVMAGCDIQPNAYFWSGNSDIKMDPSYFPFEQYQLAGSADDRITGFGKQQSFLVVFKENSVGKTHLNTQEINGRLYIDLPYTNVNTEIGCDLPHSIQLIENNLVFANKIRGVYFIHDTSDANENNITLISKKVNGNPDRPALLSDLSSGGETSVFSLDDGTHYMLAVLGHVWVWDYELSTEKDPSWFLLTNINTAGFVKDETSLYHVALDGRLVAFTNSYTDFNEPIERMFKFPVMYFGSYDALKNINSVIITLGAYEPDKTKVTYITDYEEREDLTDLEVIESVNYPERKAPGNREQSDLVPAVLRRRPHCRRVLHFTMVLKNDTYGDDFELSSAQVFYNMQGRLR